MYPSTFSIVAYDPPTGELGIAVESKFLSVGAVVPWARAGVGAIATQSWANTSYGPRGLRLLSRGLSAQETLDRLVAADKGRSQRQLGIVDAQGRAATYTGKECFEWAGGLTGPDFACQGNILAGPAVVTNMAQTFQATAGDLADRLLAALAAGQAAGGDRRGQQSAALLIVKEKGGYGGWNDRYVDLRVDDHPRPIEELQRLLGLYKLYFFKTEPGNLVRLDEKVAREIQGILRRSRDYDGEMNGLYDEVTRQALTVLMHRENLEERCRDDEQIDAVVLNFMRALRF